MATVTAGGAINAALGNIEPGWRRAPGAMVVVLVAAALNQVFSSGPLSLLGVIMAAAAGTLAAGALYRLAVQTDHPGDPAYLLGPGGFQWTGFEWRILGAGVVVGLILLGIAIVGFLVWGVILGIMIAAHLIDPGLLSEMNATPDPLSKLALFFGGPAGVVNVVLLLAAAAGFLWLAVRLSLVQFNAAVSGRFDIGGGWALTRGVGWPILAAWAVIGLIIVVLGALMGVAGMIVGKAAGGMLGAMVGEAISVPAAAGLAGYVYRAKHAAAPTVAQVFA